MTWRAKVYSIYALEPRRVILRKIWEGCFEEVAKNLPTEIRSKFYFELKFLGADTLELAQIIMSNTSRHALSIPPGPEAVYSL